MKNGQVTVESSTQIPSCSIIVCTYNRAESLQRTLSVLQHQAFPSGRLDILVVDNNSSDHTREIVENASKASAVPIRYIFEPVQGLSKARNTGISSTENDIIIFLDDDAYPEDYNWAKTIASVFSDSTIAVAGGDADPVWPSSGRPHWISNNLLGYLGIVDFDYSTLTDLAYPNYPFGVNIAFRSSFFEQHGSFREGIGRHGNSLLSGEETELCKRAAASGLRVVYVPNARVSHVMAEGRLEHDWFLRRSRFQGISKAMIEQRDTSAIDWNIRLTKRLFILSSSTFSWVVFEIFRASRLAFTAKCKMTMSSSYLKTIFNNSPISQRNH